MTKPMFNLGDRVLVRAATRMDYECLDPEREVLYPDAHVFARRPIREPLKDHVVGWVVGAVRRQLGTYRHGGGRNYSMFGEDPDGYEPSRLEIDETILLWKVAVSLCGTPMEVQESDLVKLGPESVVPQAPWRKGTPWPEHWKETVKNWPRDEKGRWIAEKRDD